MNRLIKFRAWVIKEKTMIGHREVIERVHRLFEDNFENGSDIIMQFTGLLDKNGKEIYEGDVIEQDDFSQGCYLTKPQPQVKKIIKWDNSLAGYGYIHKNCNVIGNIYDNPELTN